MGKKVNFQIQSKAFGGTLNKGDMVFLEVVNDRNGKPVFRADFQGEQVRIPVPSLSLGKRPDMNPEEL